MRVVGVIAVVGLVPCVIIHRAFLSNFLVESRQSPAGDLHAPCARILTTSIARTSDLPKESPTVRAFVGNPAKSCRDCMEIMHSAWVPVGSGVTKQVYQSQGVHSRSLCPFVSTQKLTKRHVAAPFAAFAGFSAFRQHRGMYSPSKIPESTPGIFQPESSIR